MVAPDRAYWLTAGLALTGLACGKANDKKLDDIAARLERIEKKLEAPPRPLRPPTPPEQDTKTVFAVPIDGDPFIGPPVAKVTIVEATDFA
jgi:protein-disulfide isomerase